VTTCSECADDGDCAGSSLCVPELEVASFAGAWVCAAPGSVANGHTCDFAGSGDASCASGHCAVADVMDVLELGICSECEDDGDCSGGQSCEPPFADGTTIQPGTCV
ncbi:MAG TPA: hypothetical protein VFG69_18845, partial [Nannocystaceae bacterium]|nr:hypothetical protein [Nannocystaceae bacterium]